MNPVATLNDGEIFGEMGLMFKQPRSADVLSLQSVKVLEIPAEALQESMQDPFKWDLLWKLWQVKDRNRKVHNYFDEIAVKILNVFLFFPIDYIQIVTKYV